MQKTIPAIGNYAFWYYDRYPYLLGGQITDPYESFKSQNPNYPQGQWHRGESVFIGSYRSYFTPRFCLNDFDGKELLDEIKRLERVAWTKQQALNEDLKGVRSRSPIGKLDPRT
jgi:hypothetical protein